MVAMAVVTLLAIGSGSIAWWQRGEANHNAEVAQRNAEEAQRNQSRALAALANIEAVNGSPATAVRLALAAVPPKLTMPARAYVREAEAAVLESLQHMREWRRSGGQNAVLWAAFTPDGSALAVVPDNNTARVQEISTGNEIALLNGHEDAVLSAGFSPDCRILATGSSDRTARLWEVASGKQIAVLRGHEGSVRSLAISPNGRAIVTFSEGAARLWEVPTGKEIAVLGGVGSAVFSADGEMLATNGSSTIRL